MQGHKLWGLRVIHIHWYMGAFLFLHYLFYLFIYLFEGASLIGPSSIFGNNLGTPMKIQLYLFGKTRFNYIYLGKINFNYICLAKSDLIQI